MANKSVVLYQYVKVRIRWKYIRAIEPLKRLSKGYYCLGWYEGAVKQWENVGADPQKVTEALEKTRLQLTLSRPDGNIGVGRLIRSNSSHQNGGPNCPKASGPRVHPTA